MLYPNRYRFFVFYGSIEEATINLTSGEGTITMSGRKLLISGRHFPLVFSFFAHLLPAEQTPGFAQNPMQRNIETVYVHLLVSVPSLPSRSNRASLDAWKTLTTTRSSRSNG